MNVLNQASGDNYTVFHGDCVDVLKGIPDAMLIVDPKNYQDGDDGERVQVLTADTIVEAKKFLVENMLKSHTWEEFNVLHPEIRASIVEKLIAKRTESGKKK